MGNNLEDDFTPEEKELLKREMRHRIQQQRNREQVNYWQIPGVMILVGLAGITGAIAIQGPIVGVGASPLAPVLLLIGSAVFAIGLVLMWVWHKR